MTIDITPDVSVKLIDHSGSDQSIVRAARVSLLDDANVSFEGEEGDRNRGLIRYLARERHGTPFEHNSVTFRVEAPIFVFREWHRHRIQSFNEMSGRYTEMLPRFYAPHADRPLVNIGTSARPKMGPADQKVVDQVRDELVEAYTCAWGSYQYLLGLGIAKEVARLVLPVGIMSQMYATANLRAWLHFISLRTGNEEATFVSRPQREIEMAAEQIEAILEHLFPVAIQAFRDNGRVAP